MATLVPGLAVSACCISQSGIRRVERSLILATMSPGLILAVAPGLPFSTATTKAIPRSLSRVRPE